jgi:hypothetical protein
MGMLSVSEIQMTLTIDQTDHTLLSKCDNRCTHETFASIIGPDLMARQFLNSMLLFFSIISSLLLKSVFLSM